MIKLLSTIILILVIVLFPPAALAFVSQNAIPGDKIYPIKRGLEDVILKMASVNPNTQAWFSVNVSNRRFDESKALLLQGKDAEMSLNDLVTSTNIAASEINNLDSGKKTQLAADLTTSIGQYQTSLVAVQTQLSTQVTLKVSPSYSPTPAFSYSPTPSPSTSTPTSSPSAPATITIPTIPSTPIPTPSTIACPKIPSHACDPSDLTQCKYFDTPCDVPNGWINPDNNNADVIAIIKKQKEIQDTIDALNNTKNTLQTTHNSSGSRTSSSPSPKATSPFPNSSSKK